VSGGGGGGGNGGLSGYCSGEILPHERILLYVALKTVLGFSFSNRS